MHVSAIPTRHTAGQTASLVASFAKELSRYLRESDEALRVAIESAEVGRVIAEIRRVSPRHWSPTPC